MRTRVLAVAFLVCIVAGLVGSGSAAPADRPDERRSGGGGHGGGWNGGGGHGGGGHGGGGHDGGGRWNIGRWPDRSWNGGVWGWGRPREDGWWSRPRCSEYRYLRWCEYVDHPCCRYWGSWWSY